MASVELLGVFGDDRMVSNCARVSYNKWKKEFDESDAKLIRYLAAHLHISPFFHPQLQFRITCNLAVAAQLKRHQVGLAINEVSRRYVDDTPTFDLPYGNWRKRPPKGQSKQGSGERFTGNDEDWVHFIALRSTERAMKDYQDLLNNGVAPEQARLVLPTATETTFIWTGSLYAFVRVCKERCQPDTQAETRAVGNLIKDALIENFPHSCQAWNLA